MPQKVIITGFWIALLMAFHTPLWAIQDTDTPSAESLINAGDFAAAIDAGRVENTAQGHSIAAKAELILARFYADEDARDIHIESAITEGHLALTLAADNREEVANALFQLGAAWGLRARYQQNVSYARRAEDYLVQALENNPNNAAVLAGLGGWHGEAVARAGGLMARLILGARRSEMERYFDAAIALDPENMNILSGQATTHLRLGKAADLELARRRLNQLLAMTPVTGLDKIIQTYAQTLLSALDTGDRQKLKDIMETYRAADIEVSDDQ